MQPAITGTASVPVLPTARSISDGRSQTSDHGGDDALGSNDGGTCFSSAADIADPAFAPTQVPVDLDQKLSACGGSSTAAECRYSIGRTYYEAHRYDRAGAIFLAVAHDPGSGDLAPYAAQLALDCLDVVGSRSATPRTQCFDDMAVEVPRMRRELCASGPSKNPDLCELLDRIQLDLDRLDADRLVRKADQGDASATALFRRAGSEYMSIAIRHCLPPNRKKAATEHCDELVYNAYRSFVAGKDDAKAEEAKRVLLDPKNGMSKSELAKKLARSP